MDLDEYQTEARRTRDAPFPDRERPMIMALGLCGEAGEVADLLKKWAWHGLTEYAGSRRPPNPGDVVLTPLMGVGSEVHEAVRYGRKAIGIELKRSYYVNEEAVAWEL